MPPGCRPWHNLSRIIGGVMRRQKQLELDLPRRGGPRDGAGRKPKGPRALVSHAARPRFNKPTPVHVTVRVAQRVWNLRSRRSYRVVTAAFAAAAERLIFGINGFESAAYERRISVSACTYDHSVAHTPVA